NPSLLCHHRLPAVGPMDGRQADAADLRNGLPLPARLGRPGRAAGPPQKTQASRRLIPLLSASAGPFNAARLTVQTAPDSTSSRRPIVNLHVRSATLNAVQSLSRTGVDRPLLRDGLEAASTH